MPLTCKGGSSKSGFGGNKESERKHLKQQEDKMEKRHPVLQLIYFAAVTLLTLCVEHPLVPALSLAGSLCCTAMAKGKAAFVTLGRLLPFLLLAAVINPLFNHRGAHILFYLPNSNAFTEEALVFGLCSAMMLGAVLLWCIYFNAVFGTDRLAALTGRRLPRLTLLLNMSLALLPQLLRRIREIDEAKRGMGETPQGKSLKKRISYGAELFSALLDRELEACPAQAAALRAQGCELTPRSSFNIFRFTRRDMLSAGLLLLCALGLCLGRATLQVQFFPVLRLEIPDPAATAACAILFTLPLLMKAFEVMKWHFWNAKI